jgi:hypothetical protein
VADACYIRLCIGHVLGCERCGESGND